ncbi:MAG: iron-containing alcohol dehydrogenase [Desulfobacterales bacterium]|nr:iron-containing alcohol dehydrogenase [Desulfobacterales bacterium]
MKEIDADKSKVHEWAEAAYKEKRLLGNTPRDLTVEDIAGIFERSF